MTHHPVSVADLVGDNVGDWRPVVVADLFDSTAAENIAPLSGVALTPLRQHRLDSLPLVGRAFGLIASAWDCSGFRHPCNRAYNPWQGPLRNRPLSQLKNIGYFITCVISSIIFIFLLFTSC